MVTYRSFSNNSAMTINLGAALRHLRKITDITQEQLAERVGSDAASVSKFENNLREPKLDLLQDIARVLGVELSDVILLAETMEMADLQDQGGVVYRVERKENELKHALALFSRLNGGQRKALQLFLREMIGD